MKKSWFGKQICLSKDRYKNRMIADRATEYLQKCGFPNRVYKCNYGKHFHLTTKELWKLNAPH